ncbi:MAG: xylulokinase [Clostridiales bacterium]|nr:xylulokinase [Clostridiales bacterium]MDK2932777.1 xylulokinase [Clostridiales bacterium]
MKKGFILGVDVGTSSVKAGIFDRDLNVIAQSRHSHMYSTIGKQVEMDGDVLFQSFLNALKPLEKYLPDVVAMGFSVLCPGMFCLTEEGQVLRPGIIHLDRRSEKQGLEIAEKVGEEEFLRIAGNLPYPGGMSVTSMLWVKQNEPEIYKHTYKLGHTNTLFVKRLANVWGTDPSNASFVGLYDTVRFSDWNDELCEKIGIPREKLPPIIASADIAGYLTKEGASLTGLKQGIPIIMGGGDTACATYGAGVEEDGQIINSTGTVEVMVLCTDKPYYSRQFLLRTHVIPGRWIVMNLIGAGGESLNWFYREFCKDMSKQEFFEVYLPRVLDEYDSKGVTFTPYLAGHRNSIKDKTASITGLTLSSTRENILYAAVEGVIGQLKEGMDTYKKISNIGKTIYYTGGGSNALYRYKQKVFSDFEFVLIDSSAMKGVAKLVKMAIDR